MFVFRIIIFDFPVVAKELCSVLKSIGFRFLSGFQELLRRLKIAMIVVFSNTIRFNFLKSYDLRLWKHKEKYIMHAVL